MIEQWNSLSDEDKVVNFPRVMAHVIMYDKEAIRAILGDIRAVRARLKGNSTKQ